MTDISSGGSRGVLWVLQHPGVFEEKKEKREKGEKGKGEKGKKKEEKK